MNQPSHFAVIQMIPSNHYFYIAKITFVHFFVIVVINKNLSIDGNVGNQRTALEDISSLTIREFY